MYQRQKPWSECHDCARQHPQTYAQCPRKTALQSQRTMIVPPDDPVVAYGHIIGDRVNAADRKRVAEAIMAIGYLRLRGRVEQELKTFRALLTKRDRVINRFAAAAQALEELASPSPPMLFRDRDAIITAIRAARAAIDDDGFRAWSPKDPSLKTPSGRPDSWRPQAISILREAGVGTREAHRILTRMVTARTLSRKPKRV